MDSFSGVVVAISGVLGGIGKVLACELSTLGADIAGCDVIPRPDSAVVHEIEKSGQKFFYRPVDVTSETAVSSWLVETEETLGLPDIVIATAAIVEIAPFDKLQIEAFKAQLDVNLLGSANFALLAARAMVANKRRGHIIFLGSVAGQRPQAHIPAYCISKAGVSMLARSMALHYAPHNILVNEIVPGFVDAGMNNLKPARADRTTSETVNESELVPLQRLVNPSEITAAVVFLCRQQNRNITGTQIVLDGGLMLNSAGATDFL